MSWEKVKLGDISASIQTGPFGSQLHQSDYSEQGTPVIMPKDLMNGHISELSIARVTQNHVDRLSRHKVEVGDILYSRRGDVGRCAFATEKEQGWLCGTGCLRVTIDTKKAVPKFVFYQLQKPETVGWVEKHAVGATMLNLNTSILSDVPIEVPCLAIQKKIVDILSAYDNLIENNQKQIKLLEEAAQRLYKEWFVDLRFPGYETTPINEGIPVGWEKKCVGNLIIRLQRTKQIMTSEYLDEGKYPVVDQSRSFIAGYTNEEASLVDFGEPVIVFGDHTRILKYITFPFAKGADGTQLIVSSDVRMPQPLLYCSLLNVDLSNYHYARHFKYLKQEMILVPTIIIAGFFNEIASSIYQQIHLLRNEITKLTQARDVLLPNLMSGKDCLLWE